MYDRKDIYALEFVVDMLDEISSSVHRHGSACDALSDFESKNSILMNLIQIGEKLNSLKSEELRQSLPVKEAYSVRNRITHDYGGIDLEIVESIIVHDLPAMKEKILAFLGGTNPS